MGKFFITLLLLVLFTSGAAHADGLIGRNVLIGQYGLEDTAMLDAFIKEFEVTEASLKTVDIAYLFGLYKANAESAHFSFDYLFERAEDNARKELLPNQIVRIAFFENPNNQVNAFLFDFLAEKAYLGDFYIYHDIREAEAIPLDREKEQMLAGVLAACKVNEWQAFYQSAESASATHSGWLSWALSIEYNDGGIRMFSGSGPDADHFPDHYAQLYNSLRAIAQ